MARPRKPARLKLDTDRGVWTIHDGDYKRRTAHGPGDRSAAEAELALYVIERDRRAEEEAVIIPSDDDPTNQDPRLVSIATCLAFYGQAKEGTSNASLTGHHIANLLRHWGGKTLAQVKAASCRAYVEARCKERWRPPGAKGEGKLVKAVTAGRELQTLGAAIGHWHREFTLHAKPVVTLPPAGKAHVDWLTEVEYARLLKVAQGWRWASSDLATREPNWERAPDTAFVAAWKAKAGDTFVHDDHLERFIEIGFYSGTRSGAILGLRWKRDRIDGWVDFNGVTLNRAGPEAPPSRKRQPPCRIHDRLLPRLLEWRKADMASGLAPTHVVHERGASMDRVDGAFGRAAALAGLDRREIDGSWRVGNEDEDDDLGMPTPHILRHTRATLMLRAGVPPHEVGEYLGMTVKMVLETYGHTHSEYQKRAAAA
ncbi:integrase [Methylorubrum thiocyanatum]|uniref:integrase n=1 Tax=Methylorubrum thiocyanatum TaxID=47958 RepID=UPI00383B9C2A